MSKKPTSKSAAKSAEPQVTPNPPPTTPDLTTEPKTANMEQILAESQATVMTATAENLEKKKRGRKPGGKNQTQAGPAPLLINEERVALSAKFLEPMVAGAYGLAAARTGFDGFRVTEPEKQEIAKSAALVIELYAPTLDPRVQALFGCLITVGSITWAKYDAYEKHLAEKSVKLEQ